jgi:uncharacterized protein (DUF433 family)
MSEHPFVEETPGIGGGYPQVRGTRTPVRCIVNLWRQTDDLEQVAAMLPHLTREQLQGALDYYWASPDRVNEDIERNKRTWVQLTGQPWPD